MAGITGIKRKGAAGAVAAFAATIGCGVLLGSLADAAGVSDPKPGRYAGIGDERLRLGFDVGQGQVEAPSYSVPFGGCSAGGTHPAASDTIDAQGRFRMDIASSATSETSIRGRFRTRKRARGRFVYEQTNPMVCPGTYKRDYVTARIASIPTGGGGSGNPRNGRYAGGSDDTYVWLDVEDGVVASVSVRAVFPNCGKSNGLGDDNEPPDPDGRFSISEVDGPDDVRFRGRFRTRTTVIGKIKWLTTSDCPAGEYTFPYAVQRLELPG